MVGFLWRKRCYRSGEHYRASPGAVLLVEPEVTVQMDADVPAGASAEQGIVARINQAAVGAPAFGAIGLPDRQNHRGHEAAPAGGSPWPVQQKGTLP